MQLISSRRNNLHITTFTSLDSLEQYAEQSVSTVYYLILEGCDVRNVHADHAASHLGKAQGIVQQLRAIPHARRLGFVPVPQDVLARHRLSQEGVVRAQPSDSLIECTFEVASRAHQHLTKARALLDRVPQGVARDVLLPAIGVSNYLDRLQRVGYDALDARLKQRTWKFLPQLWLAHMQNRY